MLQDSFGRNHDYLRISIIDKCNLRCTYCMPSENMKFMHKKHLMTPDEIFTIASEFVSLGIRKIRLTGGEPLLRPDFEEIFLKLSTLPVSLHITTNGVLLDQHLDFMIAHGLKDVNISLDSLQSDKFNSITQRDEFNQVSKNIELALAKGLQVKINNVLIKGVNDDEVIPFVELTKHKNMSVRFIEFMPFDGNHWNYDKTVLLEDILDSIRLEKKVIPLSSHENDTSKMYQIEGYKGDFGIISTVSASFCSSCNRVRLTADGKIKNCLFSFEESDLLTRIRDNQNIRPTIEKAIRLKKKALGGLEDMKANGAQHPNRAMISIGG